MSELTHLRKKLNVLLADYSHARKSVREEKTLLKEAGEHLRACEQAQVLLQEVAQSVQQRAHAHIASVVTRCLKAVFGPDSYSFHISFERKRGRTEARLSFRRGNLELDPADETGGGCVDVASFALRLSALMLSRPRLRRLVVADEPFRFVSKEYQPQLRELLEKLAEELDFQFVLVTHNEELVTGKVVEL